ncbi:cytochrome c [Ramlibacter rhizophilus]|uniref:Cytochrome c n=1 Tax=Ramlibacter rhizophilus TaxID=1781167 RepID=A0A4Z0BER1_9BURK|nr:cytochrome c [Ramlibacter rhizophilus]TFY96943.1 cytochrome c [Ramlibacter rhizophilus]
MKRLLVLLLVALLLLLAGYAAWRVFWEDTSAPPPGRPAAATPSMVERGAYLARAGNCMACHTARGGAPYAGGRGIDTPFGTVYAGNLTPARTGLGGWTGDDFWQALHHGRSPGGRLLYPAFPYPNYTQVTRADADALFAYLQSLPAVERENTPHTLQWPVSTQAALRAWRALYFRPGVHQDDPARSAEWNRGAYLVRGLGHCSACHSTRNALGASDLMDLSGGMIPMQSWYAPSLAAPAEAGVADWPTQRIVELLGTGRTTGASTMGPMAEVVLHSTQHLSRADLEAMATFLRGLPPERHAAPAAKPASSAVTQRGAALYREHCAQCHGEQGQGVEGAYPPLAGNRAVTLPVTANLVQAVIYGGFPPSTQGNPRPFGMPPFALELDDAEVAAVLSYIRGAWGNAAGGVSELDVAQQRSTRP